MSLRATLGAVLALAGAAHAQFFIDPDITAVFTLSWQEDPGGPTNGNGFLEPGERALITVSVSFTGQNTLRAFAPAIGPFSTGVIKGFAGAYFDVINQSSDPSGLYNGGVTQPNSTSTGPNAGSSGTSGYGVRGGWRLGGNVANGTPVANGFRSVGPGQLPTYPGSANTTAPLAGIYRLSWTPGSYAPRFTRFTISPNLDSGPDRAVALYVDLDGGTTGAAVFIPLSQVQFGSVDVSMGDPLPCYANCDLSVTPPILNVLDFGCFLNRFAAGDSYANCDGSTTPPVLNVLDFACFMNRFAAGCP